MSDPSRQPGDEVLKRGDRFFPLDVDPAIDRLAWVKWEGEGKFLLEPAADLIKWHQEGK